MVASLREACRHPKEVAEVVRGLVRRAEVIEAALGAEDRCGVTTLEAASDLTVHRIVWPAGIRIPPHDHHMWAVVGVYRGTEHNQLYVDDPTGLVATGSRLLEEGDVLVLGEHAIHAMTNPGSRPCVALHVYGGDLQAMHRTNWDFAGRVRSPHNFDDGMRVVERLRAKEDELGRPLTGSETLALIEPPT